MRTMQSWLDSYSSDHQNPTNARLHWLCVPPIVWSVIALLWAASGTPAGRFAAAAAGLAAAACLLSLLGALVARRGALAARAIPVATVVGVAVASLAFRLREVWVAWLV